MSGGECPGGGGEIDRGGIVEGACGGAKCLEGGVVVVENVWGGGVVVAMFAGGGGGECLRGGGQCLGVVANVWGGKWLVGSGKCLGGKWWQMSGGRGAVIHTFLVHNLTIRRHSSVFPSPRLKVD